MYCYNCGQLLDEGDRFCRFCGTALNMPPVPKKGSRWVPIVAMVLLCAIGIGLFFAIPYGSTAAPGHTDANCFSVRDGMLYFDISNYSGSSELIVPDTVDGQKVTSLSDGCFENCTSLTSVVLPDSLESIGKRAFRGCTGLRGIEIPESVIRIGIEAFQDCTALEAVCLSDTLEYVGPGTFAGCDQLYYIMFLGKHADWVELYDEFITPYTGVFCDDGSFYQGKPAN